MNDVTNSKLKKLKQYAFDKDSTLKFIEFLMQKTEVIAPQNKGQASYSYEIVKDAKDVVLDYPRTIQPLKKFFLPPVEDLLAFDLNANTYQEEKIEAKDKIFFGIHNYELEGIKRLDYSFKKGNPESNYLTRREKSMFIGISYEPDSYHFSESVGIPADKIDGFCLFFDKISNKSDYMVFVVDENGQKLIDSFGKVNEVKSKAEITAKKFQNKVKLHYNRIPQVFDHVYKSKVWDKVAERCVGCGTCNLLCATCYCFDVRDEIEINAKDGKRTRFWDGCMLNTFAEVAGGENFREKLNQRTRHRLYRKFKYITDHSGELHCIGCGRCSKYCPADISIVEIINSLIDDYTTQQKKN
ncbi:MAG: 4Fe-4S dicluster domain-containing protein [Calditrichaceae bacterium]|nr:4Fe-4S dicluster domain-containing protein [Calditrichaceae bacterium]MBN2709626.1 4Fe-4S dicluster domain-containing protein [Calditrichaceae bacterium]RQV92422.1 MAG: hypothetical protein EH224_15595 [Calditrichota bacterium]